MAVFDNARIKQDFGKAAASYDAHAVLQLQVLRNLLAKAKALWSENAFILDAGCGTGRFAREMERGNIVQLDLSYNMCVVSGQNGKPVVSGTIDSLPFADSTFDVLFSSLALQWVSDWRLGVKEMSRVLKPGGVLALSTFGESSLHELRESFASVDGYPHVSPFVQADGFWQKEVVTEYFPDLASIMRALRSIGAGNKLSARSKALMTPGKLKKIERFYQEHFSCDSGLPVTWEILYSVGHGRHLF